MHISTCAFNAWTYIKPPVTHLNDIKKKMFHCLNHWTCDDYHLGPSGAKNAELILLKNVLFATNL